MRLVERTAHITRHFTADIDGTRWNIEEIEDGKILRYDIVTRAPPDIHKKIVDAIFNGEVE